MGLVELELGIIGCLLAVFQALAIGHVAGANLVEELEVRDRKVDLDHRLAGVGFVVVHIG